jgi:hypothetical protein
LTIRIHARSHSGEQAEGERECAQKLVVAVAPVAFADCEEITVAEGHPPKPEGVDLSCESLAAES